MKNKTFSKSMELISGQRLIKFPIKLPLEKPFYTPGTYFSSQKSKSLYKALFGSWWLEISRI